MEGKWEFKTAAGNPSKSFSSVLDPEGNWPLALRLTADIGTDPSTWFGLGWLGKTGKLDDIVKAIPGTQKNIVKNIKTAMPEGSDWMKSGNVTTKGSTLTYDDLIKMNQDLVNKGVISKVNPIGYVHGTSSASLPNILTNKGLLPRNMFPEGQVPMVGEMSGLGTYNKYGPINQVNQTGLSVAPISNTTDALNYANSMSKNKININSLLEGHNTMIDDVARFDEPWVKNSLGEDYYEKLLNIKKNRISNFHNADIASQNIMEQNYPMVFGINPKSTTNLGKDRFFSGISSDLGQEAAIKDAINLNEISNVFVPKNKIQLTKDYFGENLGNIMIKDIGTLPKTYRKYGGSLLKAQDGDETSLFNLNTDIREIYPDLDEIIENRDWDKEDMDERFRNWIEQQKENISYKENKRKGESKKDFKNRLDNEASTFYYAYQGIEPERDKYFIDRGRRILTDYKEGERTERGDAAKEKAINYFTEYLDSPLLKTRLENLYPGDLEKQQAVIDAKKEQLAGLLIEEQDPQDFQNMLDDPFSPFTMDYYDTGTIYKPYVNTASFNDAQMDYIKEKEGYVHDILPGSIVNEISHALNVNTSNVPIKQVYDDEALFDLGYH